MRGFNSCTPGARRAFSMLAAAALTGLLACSEPTGPAITDLAKIKSVTDPTALSTQLIAQSDLPPEGTRSLFDHIAAQNNGVPYPFEKLVEAVQKLNPSGAAPIAVMLPHGRSLLKAQANDENPRVLIAADFQGDNKPNSLGLNARGQLFLGFVENANEIEVISYNEAAGRYEFQLVQDYRATGGRKLVYARRQICTTCHQGGAPIFPQRPWSETNANSDTSQAIRAARQAAGKPVDMYLGLPTFTELSNPERFDELTDVGNFFAATQKLWLDGCGKGSEGIACRRQMFKLALRYGRTPGDFSVDGEDVKKLVAYQTQQLGTKTIAVPESDLSNRDPNAEFKSLNHRLKNLLSFSKPGKGAKDNEDLEAFDKLPKLPAVLDPLTVRPAKRILTAKDVDGVYGLASLMTRSDISSLYAAAGQQENVLFQAIDRLPDTLFDAQPFFRVKMMRALLDKGVLPGGTGAPQYAFLDTSEMSAPIATGVPPLALSKGSVLEPFSEYCFSCHRGNPAKKLNFMAGANEAEVLAQIKAKSEIRDALDWARYENTDKASKLMPPRDSAQYHQLTEDLKKNPKQLEAMKSVVPSLFSF